MPNYFQQAQPYNVGEAPNISGALATGLHLRNQNRQLSLQQAAGVREQKRFEIETDPEAMKRKQEAELLAMDSAQLAHLQNITKFVTSQVPSVEWDDAQQDYQGFRNYMMQEMPKMGAPPELLAQTLPEGFKSKDEFEKWKQETLGEGTSLKDQIDLALNIKKLNEPGKADTDIEAAALAAFKKKNPDATPEQLMTFAQQLKGKGVKMTLPDGTVVEVGGGASDMTTKTKGEIEGKIIGGKEQLARMETIAEGFKPEFQEVGTRLGASWTGLMAKMGSDVPEKDKQTLIEFKQHQRKSIENINLYIKEFTGAQMSENEADRLRLAQPDPGEKWYQGDDPITFKAKVDDVLKGTRAAISRWEYYKSKGLSDSEIKGIINSNSAVSLDEIMSKME